MLQDARSISPAPETIGSEDSTQEDGASTTELGCLVSDEVTPEPRAAPRPRCSCREAAVTLPAILATLLFLPFIIGSAVGAHGLLGARGSGPMCLLALVWASVASLYLAWAWMTGKRALASLLLLGALLCCFVLLSLPALLALHSSQHLADEVDRLFPANVETARDNAFSFGSWLIGPLAAEVGSCKLRPLHVSIPFKSISSPPDCSQQPFVRRCGSAGPLFLDVYLPELRGAPGELSRPLLFFVHGGWWWSGDRTWHHACFFEYFLNRGFVLVSAGYRLTRDGYVGTDLVEDVVDGLMYVIEHAEQLGVDKRRVIVQGESAGGHLAVLASLLVPSGLVRGVVDLWGVQELRQGYSSHVRDNWPEAYSLFCGGNPVTKPGHLAEIGSWVHAQFLGSERRGCFHNMSTTSHVAEQSPPMLLLHGTADTVVSFDQSVALADALQNFHVPNLLVPAPQQVHGCWGVPSGICIQYLLFVSERFFAWTFAGTPSETAEAYPDDMIDEVPPFWLLTKPPPLSEDEKLQASAAPSAAQLFQQRELGKVDAFVETDTCILPLAPKAQLGSAIHDRHRVLQVSLGREHLGTKVHGLLLSDAGIAFTWGDNRFGQLGREPVVKEENGRPYPVKGLVGHEVTQVSAGMHHSLALVAPGLARLGANKDGQIISAGTDSSVAAALNSNIWQWGQISDGFQDQLVTSDKSKKSSIAVVKNRLTCPMVKGMTFEPFRVFQKDEFRSQMRAGRVSISSTGCKDTYTDKVRVETLVQGLKSMQESINKERLDIASLDAQQVKQKDGEAQAGSATENELDTLQDTIGELEHDIMVHERDIDALTKSLESCDLRQVSLQISMAPKAGAERRKLEEQLAEVEEFVQANKNTRMTLLDQRAETDKEKQSIAAQLADLRRQKDRAERRLGIAKGRVRDLSKSTQATSSGASDLLIKVLHQQCTEVEEYFENRKDTSKEDNDFLAAMKILEMDKAFLDRVENKMKEKMKEMIDGNMRNGDRLRSDRAQMARHPSVGGLLDVV
ncbi:Isoprenylcysteine alpha-carbonyl methylesterase ICME [Symbiodinium microadriaticum]|uniref:Isoprenylcysteine alpha-carbonyl methylesterase ICME n=1 Tax=Symbiodinium microadriaticum TaxID=2951 RepID=A0A1Q9C5K5_SYMMI|nr:Isoprenylcysteine alpha-carbonyl methylesterase ICME [Symbiodinium microadriaticum]